MYNRIGAYSYSLILFIEYSLVNFYRVSPRENGVKCVAEFGPVPACIRQLCGSFFIYHFATCPFAQIGLNCGSTFPMAFIWHELMEATGRLTEWLTAPLDNRKLLLPLLLLLFCCCCCLPHCELRIQIHISLFAAFVLLFRPCFEYSKVNSNFSFKNEKWRVEFPGGNHFKESKSSYLVSTFPMFRHNLNYSLTFD